MQAVRPGLVQVLQHASDAISMAAEPALPQLPRITYAPFADALDRIAATWDSSAEAALAWERDLGLPRNRDSLAAALLAHALAADVPVVFSTTRAESIGPLVTAAMRPDTRTLGQSLLHWLTAHLPS